MTGGIQIKLEQTCLSHEVITVHLLKFDHHQIHKHYAPFFTKKLIHIVHHVSELDMILK